MTSHDTIIATTSPCDLLAVLICGVDVIQICLSSYTLRTTLRADYGDLRGRHFPSVELGPLVKRAVL